MEDDRQQHGSNILFTLILCLFFQKVQYQLFKQRRTRTILLCTEVASRGLDFGNIDWVINFDVPADTKSYIHRVGRAARLGQKGNSISFLTEHETGFVRELRKHNIECRKLGVHSKNLKPIHGAFQTILAKDERMMDLAKSAFKSFLAFYYFYGNRQYMDPDKLDKDDLAKMFGLVATPKYKRFLKKCKSHKLSTMPTELKALLLDNKRKRKQKAELLRIAAQQQLKEIEDLHDDDDDDDKKVDVDEVEREDVPEWFQDAFKDRKEDGDGDEENRNSKGKGEGDEDGNEGDEVDSDEDDDLQIDDDDIEEQALAAILERD